METLAPSRTKQAVGKQKSDFRLVGLSRPLSMTCELLHTDRETFWPKVGITQERFNALWDYCVGNWKDKKIAEIVHDGLNEDGTPINPVVVAIREWDLG